MNQLRFNGKVAIVTGAGAGLGRAHALLLASRGAKVVVNDLGGDHRGVGKSSRSADIVVEEIRQAGGTAVADYNSVVDGDKVLKTALDNFGRVDILINNAGVLRDKSFPRISKEDWDIVLDVHLKGTFLLTQAAFSIFKKQGYGRIVMTSSGSGLYGNFGQVNYAAAKMGVVGLANTVAIEGAKYNIHCNVIVPLALSRLTEAMTAEFFKEAKPELIAPVVAYLCHESCTENGTVIDSALGWAGKVHLVCAEGALLRKGVTDSVTIETVRDNWKTVIDMKNAEALQSVGNVYTKFENVVKQLKATEPASASNIEFGFTKNDTILYALGVGASVSRSKGIQFLYENHEEFNQIPSFFIQPSILAQFQSGLITNAIPGKIVSFKNILHGEQYLEIIDQVPVEGKLYSNISVAELLDKGTAGVVVFDVDTFNNQHKLVLRNQIVIFATGCGNFGGARSGNKIIPAIPKPKRNPDTSVSYKTSDDQAALFRLSGDSNPLHIDPNFAKQFGFEEPILHGLCTLGISIRIVLETFANCDSSLFKALKVRFSKPVLPGQTLNVNMWQEGNRIHFETTVLENNTVVITGAYVDLKSVVKNSNSKL